MTMISASLHQTALQLPGGSDADAETSGCAPARSALSLPAEVKRAQAVPEYSNEARLLLARSAAASLDAQVSGITGRRGGGHSRGRSFQILPDGAFRWRIISRPKAGTGCRLPFPSVRAGQKYTRP